MKYFRDLFFREQRAGESSAKLYSLVNPAGFGSDQATHETLAAAQTPPSQLDTRGARPPEGRRTSGELEGRLAVRYLNTSPRGAHQAAAGEAGERGPNVSLLIGHLPEAKTTLTEKTTANSGARDSTKRASVVEETEDDWIVVNAVPKGCATHYIANNRPLPATKRLQQMALSEIELNLIKASWVPIREDPVTAGLLLFRGLFTKYPEYLSYFSQFSINMGSMKEQKRLVQHAVKVIEKVTIVVDALGDEAMTSQLNEALVKLVRSHLAKKIGVEEFTNLGKVLIDFIFNVNYHGLARADESSQLEEPPRGQVIDNSLNDSNPDTMTSELDKIRASSTPSSSSDDESYLALGKQTSSIDSIETMASCAAGGRELAERELTNAASSSAPAIERRDHNNTIETRMDFNLLRSAWRTLYTSIVDLVRQEATKSG